MASRRHGSSSSTGPACPVPGCTFAGQRFTRVDNFKVHYMRRHGKSQEEANIFIQEWKAGAGARSLERGGVVI